MALANDRHGTNTKYFEPESTHRTADALPASPGYINAPTSPRCATKSTRFPHVLRRTQSDDFDDSTRFLPLLRRAQSEDFDEDSEEEVQLQPHPPPKKSASNKSKSMSSQGSQTSRTQKNIRTTPAATSIWGSGGNNLQAAAERGVQSVRHRDGKGRCKARETQKSSAANIWAPQPRASAKHVWGGTAQTQPQAGLKMVKTVGNTKISKFTRSQKSLDAKMSEQKGRLAAGVGAGVKLDGYQSTVELGDVGSVGVASIGRVQSLEEKLASFEESKKQLDEAAAAGEVISGSAIQVGEKVGIYSESVFPFGDSGPQKYFLGPKKHSLYCIICICFL